MGRRKENPKTPRNPHWKAMKAEYDAEYRRKNLKRLTREKAAYHKATYDPARAAIVRKKRMPQHVEYCRQPKYKVYKSAYDRKRRDKKWGEFADAHAVLMSLKKEILRQMPDKDDRYRQSQRMQWSPINQARRRRERAKLRSECS